MAYVFLSLRDPVWFASLVNSIKKNCSIAWCMIPVNSLLLECSMILLTFDYGREHWLSVGASSVL